MSKTLKTLLITLLAAVSLALPASAQDTPPASSTPTAPAKPAAKAATGQTPATKTPAAKTGTGTAAKPAPLPLKTPKDKASYAIGMSMAKGMKAQGVDIDPAILARGLKDGLAGKTQMTDEEAQAALGDLQKNVRAQQEEKAKAAADVNKKQGDAFLSVNKAQNGVVALPSGLQYKILKEGTGPKPTTADTVVCNYKGTLLNGKEFDSSYKRGQPATFPVGQVIKGWTEALQLMPVGSKWQLWIPADLAYGAKAAGPDIGPNSTLVFEVELVSIAPKAEQPKGDQSKSEQPQGEQPKAQQPAAQQAPAQQPPAQPNKP
ncbi:MAG TPA: FKBP-type peptidyl-prolyl cis-trans isomerase [Candidatus Acidoferrum sp.]|jgi:FKBP-type peptidyl-prolyl cis-trans isomerase